LIILQTYGIKKLDLLIGFKIHSEEERQYLVVRKKERVVASTYIPFLTKYKPV